MVHPTTVDGQVILEVLLLLLLDPLTPLMITVEPKSRTLLFFAEAKAGPVINLNLWLSDHLMSWGYDSLIGPGDGTTHFVDVSLICLKGRLLVCVYIC